MQQSSESSYFSAFLHRRAVKGAEQLLLENVTARLSSKPAIFEFGQRTATALTKCLN